MLRYFFPSTKPDEPKIDPQLVFSPTELQLVSHLLTRAAEYVDSGDFDSATAAYKAALKGMLRAARGTVYALIVENEIVGDRAARYLADALAELREYNQQHICQKSGSDKESDEETLYEPTISPGTVPILLRISTVLLNSPLPRVIAAAMQAFISTLIALFASCNLADSIVRIVDGGCAVAGWIEENYQVGRVIGQGLAVGVVVSVKITEAVVGELASNIAKQ